MEFGNTVSQEARGLLEIAQKRMASNYPFHAAFLSKWQVYPTNSIDTVGITLRGSNILLLFNPEFIVSCSLAELIGVLHHEVNHLLFEHVFINPEDFADKDALVIAEEVTVNEWIQEPLPGSPILLAHYPQLIANEDTFARYKKLAVGNKRQKKQLNNRKKPIFSVPNLSSLVPNSNTSVQTTLLSEQNLGRNVQNSNSTKPLDDHSLWQEIRDAGLLGAIAVKVIVSEVASSLSPQQVAKLSSKLKARINAMCSDGTNSVFEELQPNGNSNVDWRKLLRKYVQEAIEASPVFTKPPRRLPELLGVFPARQYRPSKAVVMAVIDTSGSIDSNTLESIAKEIEVMAQYHHVTIVECDCIIQAVYRYSGKIQSVTGRGGTDLRPPFSSSVVNRIKPHVICYFTDGYGSAPELAPIFPVIWCITENGQRPAAWGREIIIK